MAKQLTSESESGNENVSAQHNVKHRNETIGKCLEQLYQEDKAIAAALEEHVTPHRQQKTEIKKRLREEIQLTTEVINARYATYKLERKAMDNGDDTTIDTLREMYAIAPIGTQLDLVDGLNKAATNGAAGNA